MLLLIVILRATSEVIFVCRNCHSITTNNINFLLHFLVGCSVKDCRFCATKDNCTTCNNNYVPSDGGTSCSPPIFTVPPTREPGTGRGLNTGAIIGKEGFSCIDTVDYTYLEKLWRLEKLLKFQII